MKKNSKDINLKIFVSCHKEVELFDSKVLQPIQVGAAIAKEKFPWAMPDDSGDNISNLNPMYCELTAQYWAWKNEDCDYYGFCHYRRYFNFSKKEFKENKFGEVIDSRINDETQKKYGLDDKTIYKRVKGADLITTKFQNLSKIKGDFKTPKEQWAYAENLKDEDLDLMVNVLEELHPDYAPACENYLDGSKTCFCNMFIMKRELFNDYCEWLFPILEEFCNRRDFSRYSKESLRTVGHLAERLLNIYILKNKMDGANWKHREVQCVHFTNPERYEIPKCEFVEGKDNKQTIPLVFAADNNYVPVLTVAIYSCLVNASKDYKYDVCVLNQDISNANQKEMKDFFESFSNASLRFIDVSPMIETYELKTSNEHISSETYYRFLIPELLNEYKKVIYLDSDMIIEDDISKLFEIDMKGNLVAAVRDLDFLGNLNFNDGSRIAYNKKILKMKDPYNYFQAGVLVLNIPGLKSLHKTKKWLEFAENKNLIYNDQDILNRECEGKVIYLPYEWNVMHDCADRVKKVFSFAPASTYDAYMESREDPKVIHYAGFEKPWNHFNVDFEQNFWNYALETPFCHKLLRQGGTDWHQESEVKRLLDRHQKLYHPALNVGAKVVRKIRDIKE